MPSFNKVILIGHLTRDPQLKFLPSSTAICEFGIATNHKWKGQNGEAREEVCFVDITAFARTAEAVNEYAKKGDAILVEGRLKLDQWEDKQSGAKRSKLSVVADKVVLMGSKDAPASATPIKDRLTNRPPAENPFGDTQEFKDEDLPF